MAGQVKHNKIFSSIRPDWRLAKLLFSLPSKNTDSLIGAVARVLEDEGIELVDSTKFLGPLLPAEGRAHHAARPMHAEAADIAYGRQVAQQIAGLDLGQTVVVRDRACVAIEAMEGTDETIERAARIAGGQRLVVVKVSKPKQDMRFDVPVVGVKTIEVMRRSNATALAIDAGRTLLFDRDALIRAADDAGIAIQAFAPEQSLGRSAKPGQKEIVNRETPFALPSSASANSAATTPACGASMEGAELVGVVDANADRAAQVAAEFGTRVLRDVDALARRKSRRRQRRRSHQRARPRRLPPSRCRASTCWSKNPWPLRSTKPTRLIAAAKRAGPHSANRPRGALQSRGRRRRSRIVSQPMFFEVHRLGIFTPRSLDVDVVYDVMIHDLDILLSLVNAPVTDLKAVGIPVITDKVDIAQARVEFATGTVANLTASRVSTERVRKMRFFQEHEYISLDFTRQDVLRVRVAARAARMPPESISRKFPTTPGRAAARRTARLSAIPSARAKRPSWMALPGAALWSWPTG